MDITPFEPDFDLLSTPTSPVGVFRPHVVGIGASAGGLEALSQMVESLPMGLGCVYIVAQHVSPTHRSMMPDILSRETRLPVAEVIHGQRPKLDTIYIVPPGHNLVLRLGVFHLTDTAPEISPKPSINLLFQSLAESCDERAVGIILSGTGSDGTTGLRAIKAAGGLTFAQMPETAKYDGMPRSAIEAGVVDRIVSPDQIGEELRRLFRLQASGQLSEEAQPTEELTLLFERIREHTRIDFSSYKLSTVLRRLHRRMMAVGCDELQAYLHYVEHTPNELELLARDTLISVTEFFRDKEAFRALERHARELVSQSLHEEIRIWVVGCATGEEAYSIAIVFAQQIAQLGPGRHPRLQVFATDIDNEALSVARRGVYSSAAMSEVPPEYARRYFQSCVGGFEPIKSLRDCVVFARQDVICDPPFLRVDLVTCRNVLIYFNANLQAKVLSVLHYALRDGGLLFLGRSENVAQNEERFTPLDRRSRLFKARLLPGALPPGKTVRGQLGSAGPQARRHDRGFERSFLEAVARHYTQAALLVDSGFRIVHTHGNLSPYLQFQSGAPELNLNSLLIPELRSEALTTLHRARRRHAPQRSRRRRIGGPKSKTTITLLISPLENSGRDQELFLLVFEPVQATQPLPDEIPPDSSTYQSDPQAEAELEATREHLQTLIEELSASNEELQALNEEVQAANEELQATNEELEATNEELQATNEELVSVNEESMVKSAQLAAINGDFESVYNTLEFPVLVFDAQLLLKRANLSALRLYNLPVIHTGLSLDQLGLPPWLEAFAPRLENTLRSQRKDIFRADVADKTHQVFMTPVTHASGHAQGVVLVILDQSELVQAQMAMRESHARLMAIMNHSVSIVTLKETSGRYQFVNQRFEELFGLKADEVIGRTDQQLFSAEMASLFRRHELDAMGKLQPVESSDEITLPHGRLWLSSVRFPIFDSAGAVQAICTQAHDMTQKHHAEDQLRLAAKVIDRAGEAIAITDAEGRIITVNDAFAKITGYRLDEVIGKTPALLKSGQHSKEFYDAMWRNLSEQGWWQGEVINRRKNGEHYPEWLTINSVHGNDGQLQNYVAIFSDITAIKNSQRRIEYMATHDELTGLPNRSLLMDRLKHGLAQARRQNQRLCVFFIDLDNFKHINDSLGHDVGDLLLKEAALRLRRCVRDSDTLARLGGDEFVAILQGIEIDETNQIASRIVDFLSASFPIAGKDLFVSASIGICCYPDDGNDSNTLLKNADTAMYRAKERGRNQYQFFAEEMKVLALQRLTLETGLRIALENNRLYMVYQPQIDMRTKEMIGAEALLRWEDPHLGPVSPALFIPVAEEAGLMGALGEWIFTHVLTQIRAWRAEGLRVPRIFMNVSAQQLRSPDFGTSLCGLLNDYAVPPDAIGLELTESTLMERVDVALEQLAPLEAQGVSLSIDDFGTGYSSLAYLKKLPMHEVKVDRSFVQGIAQQSDDKAITRAIIDMAHALGMRVVAEGVEQQDQLDALFGIGCDVAQGYHFHRPLLPTVFSTLLVKVHDLSS
jgi:two-component system, chemotaxis family, CheB/CheR fusion protein